MSFQHEWSPAEKAAVAYIKTSLLGRFLRTQKNRQRQAEREPLILNEPCYPDGGGPEERIDRLPVPHELPLDERVAMKVTIQQAMSGLTDKERAVIHELFWNQKRVTDLCEEWDVSKNTVLKTKRNALSKLRRYLQVQAGS